MLISLTFMSGKYIGLWSKKIKRIQIVSTMKILFRLFLELNKRMAKLVIDEFDVRHKFVNNLNRYVCNRYNFTITHNVSGEDFAIFIDYDFSDELIEKLSEYICIYIKHMKINFTVTVGRFIGLWS